MSININLGAIINVGKKVAREVAAAQMQASELEKQKAMDNVGFNYSDYYNNAEVLINSQIIRLPMSYQELLSKRHRISDDSDIEEIMNGNQDGTVFLSDLGYIMLGIENPLDNALPIGRCAVYSAAYGVDNGVDDLGFSVFGVTIGMTYDDGCLLLGEPAKGTLIADNKVFAEYIYKGCYVSIDFEEQRVTRIVIDVHKNQSLGH